MSMAPMVKVITVFKILFKSVFVFVSTFTQLNLLSLKRQRVSRSEARYRKRTILKK
jgi:hypothetical protein